MTNTTNVKQLKLNIMTQAQYDTITPSPSELYMITDAEVVPVDDAISSTSENPVQNKVIYTALNGKQDTLVSGTNIKTVNNSSLLGSGNITIDSLPSQSGQSGKFLTTNGTAASWAPVTVPVKISDLTDDTATYPIDKADTLTGLTATVAELNYTDGVTSNIQTQLNGKQATLVSGTNIKTINSTTLLGSGNISVQPTIDSNNKLSSDLVDDTNHTHKFATSAQLTQIGTNQSNISTINGKIPSAASTTNQLADKAFVNSSVQTATANFRGNWSTWANVPTSASSYPADYAGSTTPTVNDYLVVQDASDYTGETLEGTWRFKYTGTWSTDGKAGWNPEYQVNETPLTTEQLAALNSGITSSDVTLIGTALQPNDNISELTNDTGYITGISSSDVTTALGYTPYNSTNPNGYISGITSSDVTTALGYTPYNATNPNGYISGITSSDVTTALGYTPYNSTNPNGYITGISSSDVTTALGYTPYNSTNPDGYITSSDLTNYVTTNTDQNITGTKTFVGTKKIAFKQSGTSDKLGFTLYNNSGTEKGYLEFNPTNTIDGAPLMTLGNYATSTSAITQVGFRRYSSVSGANGAYNLLTPLIADAKAPFSLTTTYTNFYLPLGFTDGNTLVKAAKSGLVDISSLLPDVSDFVTNSSLATTLSSYATQQWTTEQASALATDLQTWVGNQGYLTSASLSTLTDVTLSNPTQGQNLTYDATLGKWKNTSTTATVAWGGITGTLADQTDLNTALSGKQATLVSGTNIKTINSTSLLGSGDIEVLQNTATHNPTNSLCIYGTLVSGMASTEYGTAVGHRTQAGIYANAFGTNAKATGSWSEAFGGNCTASGIWAIRIGHNGEASGKYSIAIGGSASATENSAIQIGYGTNSVANTLKIGFFNASGTHYNWQLLDGTTGLIPDARISSNIARTSDIPSITVDQTYDSTSANAQSGVAIAGAGFLKNTATATNSLTILGTTNNQNNSILIGYSTTTSSTNSTVIGNTAVSGGSYATALGYYARANAQYTTAIGYSSYANYQDVTAVGHSSQATAAGTLAVGSNSVASAQRATSIGYSSQATQYQATALGYEAKATANSALQIGTGTNSTANTLQVGSYTLLNTSTGLIPDARISSNIARTSQITTPTYDSTNERITW